MAFKLDYQFRSILMISAQQIWPTEFAERYRKAGYWRGETIGGLLRERAAASPDHLAVIGGEERWTYRELDARADALARGFFKIGLRPGDRAVVQLPNIPQFLSVIFGLFRAGVLPVFTLPAHRSSEITHFLKASEAAAYIIPDVYEGFDYRKLAEEARTSIPELREVIVVGDPGPYRALSDLESVTDDAFPLYQATPSDVAFFQLSGGSTGLSKLIPRTHDDYSYSFRASAEICELDETTVFMAVLPIAHNFPMSSPGFFGVIYAGGSVVLCTSPSPDNAFPLIEREKVTITSLVPPLLLVWLQAAEKNRHQLSSLKLLQVGGAKLTPEAARRVKTIMGVTLQQVFGMAEGLVNYTRIGDEEDIIVNTQGRPISEDDEILIVDDEGNPVPEGVAGHLLTRGPYTIRGYHNVPEVNARAFTEDGYYRTGDIVSREQGGDLVVRGRATDQINRGGEKVSAEEVEDHLRAHPQVHDAAVVSIPDPYLGERSCAFVISNGERPTSPALKAWIRSRGLAAFKVPDQVIFVGEFPSTGVGKTSRMALREALRRQLDKK